MSTNIIFMYSNLISSATLTASSEADGFPASNLKSPFRTKVWRTEGGTPGTANLVINHGSVKAVDYIALANYGWASAPATMNLEFNSSDSWGAPAATETLTWSANPTTNGNKATIIKTFTSKSYQYNRLNVVYAPGDWDLGVISLGAKFAPTRNYSYDFLQNLIDDSAVSISVGGQKHIDTVEIYRNFSLSCLIASQAQWELYQTMINAVGIRKDLFIAFDYDSEPNEMTVYGKFNSLPGMSVRYKNIFNANFGFEESR